MSWMPPDAGVAITVRSTPMSEFHLWEHKTSINIIKSPARNLESYIMRFFCCHVDASDSISKKPRSQFSRNKFAVLELSPAHWLAGPPGSPRPPGPHAANLVADLMLVWIACFERISVAKLHDLHFDTSVEEIVWLLYPLVKIYTVTHTRTHKNTYNIISHTHTYIYIYHICICHKFFHPLWWLVSYSLHPCAWIRPSLHSPVHLQRQLPGGQDLHWANCENDTLHKVNRDI